MSEYFFASKAYKIVTFEIDGYDENYNYIQDYLWVAKLYENSGVDYYVTEQTGKTEEEAIGMLFKDQFLK